MKTRAIDPTCLEDFLGLSWTIHGNDPRWVPPLRDVEARDLCGLGACGQYAELQMFLCEDNGRAVGRLAAIYNPRLPEMGQLGYLELVDDPRVLPSLLEQAAPWLAARGASALWGPIDGGAHRTHRAMVRGFETDPHLFEPRNAPWIPGLLEAAGLERAHAWYGYDTSSADARALCERLRPLAARARRRFEKVRFDPRDPATLPRLHAFLDEAWEGHLGYASLDLDEFVETYAGILAIGCDVGVVVDTTTGADVGLGLTYPDWVDEARALGGDASGWASWMGTAPLPKRVVLHTTALVPSARNTGALFIALEHAGDEVLPAYEQAVLALVTETFGVFDRFLEPTREYALYRKPL